MKVTIGIPFYNNESTLADAVRSVFAQSYTDWELLLVDDGSSDRSLEIARQINDPRVKVLSDGINLGRAGRRNHIVGIASGEFLAWLDADDMMHPDRIAKQADYLLTHPDIDVVDSGLVSIVGYDPIGVRHLHELQASYDAALSCALLLQGAAMGRIEWFRANGFDDSFKTSEDFELWVRTLGHSSFARVYEPLYIYREVNTPPAEYLAKYLESGRDVRRITAQYGPKTVGWPKALELILRSHAKCLIYRVFTMLGMQQKLVNARADSLDEEQERLSRMAIDQIMQTTVPGLDMNAAISNKT